MLAFRKYFLGCKIPDKLLLQNFVRYIIYKKLIFVRKSSVWDKSLSKIEYLLIQLLHLLHACASKFENLINTLICNQWFTIFQKKKICNENKVSHLLEDTLSVFILYEIIDKLCFCLFDSKLNQVIFETFHFL